MSNYHKEKIKYCEHDAPCILEHNDTKNISINSLTHLGLLSGTSDIDNRYSINGAQFKTINYKTPYFETKVYKKIKPPWLARQCEGTFMNRTKILNEPIVSTYKELLLSPISGNNYETIEGFGNINKFNRKIFIFIIILFFLLII